MNATTLQKPGGETTALCAAPVVLGHPAASGGSMIYKLLVSHFGFLGVYEVSAAWARRETIRQPVDPELQLLLQGILSQESMEKLFIDRLLNCSKIAAQNERPFLIREHTHLHFFDDDGSTIPQTHSWIASELRNRVQDPVRYVATVRDPVDCWLGMRRSFPTLVSYDFDAYCGRYNLWLDRIDEAKAAGRPVAIFKYEDIVTRRQESLAEIGSFLNAAPNGPETSIATVITSGNSGRSSSSSIELRPRRPYSRRFSNAARASTEYNRLIARLGYRELDNATSAQALRSTAYELTRSTFTWFIGRMRNCYRRGRALLPR